MKSASVMSVARVCEQVQCFVSSALPPSMEQPQRAIITAACPSLRPAARQGYRPWLAAATPRKVSQCSMVGASTAHYPIPALCWERSGRPPDGTIPMHMRAVVIFHQSIIGKAPIGITT